jgi:type VI secretion system secreted protein Hcp
MKKSGIFVALAAGALVCTMAGSALAAFDAFLKIEGVAGESKDAQHQQWIDVLSFNYGKAAWNHQWPKAGTLPAQSGKSGAGKLTITKTVDKSSPMLYKLCASGKHLPKLTIEFCHAEGGKQKYIEYTLTNVIVSSVQTVKGKGVASEMVSFSFQKIEWNY